MKLEDINNLIEETISDEIKSRILKEQEMGWWDKDHTGFSNRPDGALDDNGQEKNGWWHNDNDSLSQIKTFDSLAPLQDKITRVENIGDDENFGVLIHMEGISENDLMSCCQGGSLDEAISMLNKNIHNDLHKKGMGENSDVDININTDNALLSLEIKITTNEGLESLSNTTDMRKLTNESQGHICECGRTLSPTEEICECGRKNPNYVAQESAVPCVECGNQEMKEQEFTPAPKTVGKGKYGTETNKLTTVFKGEAKESELAGTFPATDNNLTDMKSDTVSENKSGKKVIRLSEEKFMQMIKNIVNETTKVKVVGKEPKVDTTTKPFKNATKAETKENIITEPSGTIPGIQAVKTAREGDGREEKEYLSSVDKKMKEYLNFDGNDIKDPELDTNEFPKQVGEGEKVAHRNSTEGEKYIDTYRGMKPQDAVYDTKPSKEFVDRVKKAMSGDSTMGNKQDKNTGNISLSKLGEKLFKDVEIKRDAMKNNPMYVKDPQPVENTKRTMAGDMRSVTEQKAEEKVIEEEIKRMRIISSYTDKD